MSSWHSYPKVYNLGHAAVRNLLPGEVIVEEKVDGCVTPDTPILKADLRYMSAGSLSVGDRLLGFDDSLNDPRLCESLVTIAEPVKKDCWAVTTDAGTVTCSGDHPWLVGRVGLHSDGTSHKKRWVEAKNLGPGDEVVSLPVWGEDTSYEAGYLAGFYDGEGSLVRYGNVRCLSAYQRTGPTADLVFSLLDKKGFQFTASARQRNEGWSPVVTFIIRGGWTEILRFLGSIRPPRLLEKANGIWVGAAMNGLPRRRVLSVGPVGCRVVTGLSTSTSTYVAAGMLCHNSQFSFGSFDRDADGRYRTTRKLRVRSRGREFEPSAPDSLFAEAANQARGLQHLLKPGWTYRAEYLKKPKHNTLAYDRIPRGHLMLFDICTGQEEYAGRDLLVAEAERLGLEAVPLLWHGRLETAEQLEVLLLHTSVLGGTRVEGVVVKPLNRDLFGRDGKLLMGKYVGEAFRERNEKSFKSRNPGGKDILEQLGEMYRAEARWEKAVQHLRESGELQDAPQDIGPLMREVVRDLREEEREAILEALFKWAWPAILRKSTRGLPEWYKRRLLERQFEGESGAVAS